MYTNFTLCLSQFPRSLRRRSAAAHMPRLWVLRMFVCYECCVLSGRGLCDELITCPEESYWLRCVVVSDVETSWMRRPWPTGGGGCHAKKKVTILHYAQLCYDIYCWLRFKVHIALTVFLFDKYATDLQFTCLIHYENKTGKQVTTHSISHLSFLHAI